MIPMHISTDYQHALTAEVFRKQTTLSAIKSRETLMVPTWCQKAKKHIPPQYILTVNGYVRNVQKLRLYSNIPTTITTMMLIYTYYFKPILSMLHSAKISKSDQEMLNIMINIQKLLNKHDKWEKSIINEITETKSINIYLDKTNHTFNQQLATILCWLLAATEHATGINHSVLMHSKPQTKIFKIILTWDRVFEVLANAMNILANISGCYDLSAKNELIQDGVLDVLRQEISTLFFVDHCEYDFSTLEYIEMIALTLKNLTHNRQPQQNNYHKYSTILCLTLHKLYKLNIYYQNKHNNTCYDYSDSLNIVKFGLKNITTAFVQLIKNNLDMLDVLMLRLDGYARLLTKCIQLLSYPKSRLVRHQIVKIFIYITADPESLHIDKLLDHGICEKIIEIFNDNESKMKLQNTQRSNMLLIISNIFASDYIHIISMLRDDKILDIIFNHLQKNYPVRQIKSNALACLNNAFATHTPEISNKLLNYKDGIIINILCSTLNNYNYIQILQCAKKISDEMECLHHLIIEMKANISNATWMMQRFKQQNITQILNKLKLIKKQKATFCVDEQYLLALGFTQYSSDIKYLSKLI